MLKYQILFQSPQADWVVLLHGMGGSSKIWYRQIDAFRPYFNLLLPDFHGHGQTREVLDAYSFEVIGKEVIRVLDHLEIPAAHLVSISLGSIIADAIHLLYPVRIKSMVQGGAAPGLNLQARMLLRVGRRLKYLMPYMWVYRLFAFITMPRRNHARSRKIFAREARKLGREEFMKWSRVLERLDDFYRVYRGAVSQEVPKLYISGAQDHLFLPMVKRQQQEERLSLLHIIPDCGHVCNIEQADDFNSAALAYLNAERADWGIFHRPLPQRPTYATAEPALQPAAFPAGKQH